ncbi:hypothetical protein [Symmachiella dynata]
MFAAPDLLISIPLMRRPLPNRLAIEFNRFGRALQRVYCHDREEFCATEN